MTVVSILAIGILVSSCGATYYHARYPVLPLPDNSNTWAEARPQLESVPGSEMGKMSPEARKAVANNFNSLIDYSRKLEATIEKYNVYAETKNEVLNDIGSTTKEKKKGVIGRLFN